MTKKNREAHLETKEREARLDLVELSKSGGFLGGGNTDAAIERNKELLEQASEDGYQGVTSGRWANRIFILFLLAMGVFLLIRLIFNHE